MGWRGRRKPITTLAVAAAAAAVAAGCAGGQGGSGGRGVADVAPGAGPAASAPRAAAEAPRSPERLAYVAPTDRPGGPVDQRVGRAPGRLFDQAQPALRGAGLRITHLDERAGVITATYAGDPSLFIDCGTIAARAVDGGGERRAEAASDRLVFRRGERRGSTALVERDLVLHARLVLQLAPAEGGGNATRLRSRATYVVSKRTSVAGGSGGADERVETIAFESGGRGSFGRGTVCQPTGALERLALVSAGA